MQYEEKSATEWLLNSAMQKEAIAYHRFIFWKSSCHFEKSSDGIFSSLQFSVLTLPNTFLLSPISQVAIIPTALSKGLADPVGNTFLHGEPKSG